MERVREPESRPGKEVRAELERAQVELTATQRKIQELEQELATRKAQAEKWAARARKMPRPMLGAEKSILLGLGIVVGMMLLEFYIKLGGPFPFP
ncbi:MAG: hypothetical protein ACJ8AT_09190 [Hyalangium sp.]|uniref:hypothetical protein n=1 Tax=Hyalangium sp. TaxID=2028555 RepID=UPI00389A57B9